MPSMQGALVEPVAQARRRALIERREARRVVLADGRQKLVRLRQTRAQYDVLPRQLVGDHVRNPARVRLPRERGELLLRSKFEAAHSITLLSLTLS